MSAIAFAVVSIALWIVSVLLPYPTFGAISVYCSAIAFCAFAANLYFLRERMRLLYGVLELGVGFLILLGTVNNFTAAIGREYIPIIGGGFVHRRPEGWLQWNATWAALLPVAWSISWFVNSTMWAKV